jgi:hypothetical protein
MDKNRSPSSPSTRREAPADLSAESADSQPNLAGFHPVTADFLPLHPASPPLPTGQNGESVVLCSADSRRPNTIYVSSGSSEPIFTFLIQFKFYPIKRFRFEKKSPPMFLEFDLVFFTYFSEFVLKISNLNSKNQ